MSMIKRVTLTINKNNNSVKLSCPLNFYKNDALTLHFEVEKYNFNINNDTSYEKIIPLSAIAYVETPEGIDSIQAAIINDNLIKVNLSQYHTSFMGTSRMQLVIRDKDGCQCATPCFTFSVNDLINDNEIITDEDGNIITSENDIPIVHGHGNGYNAISDLDEIEDLDNAYMLITKDEKSYKARTSLFGAANLEDYAKLEDIPVLPNFDNFATKDEMVINLSAKSDTTHTHDDRYATINHQHSYNELSDKPTIPSVDGLATETYVNQAIANANTVGGYTIWVGTQSQYDAIETKSNTTIYMIKG